MFKKSRDEWKDGKARGCRKFISHEDLCNPENQYLVDEKATVFCEVRSKYVLEIQKLI